MSTSAVPLRSRSLPGPHLWGWYSVRPVSRAMWSSRTLTVFPPGTTPAECWRLRAWHVWPALGALLVVVVLAVTVDRPGPGIIIGLVLYALGFVVLDRATRTLRPRVRTLTVTTFHGGDRPEVHGDERLLAGSLDALSILERALRAHRIGPVDFELVWADVWDALPAPGSPVGR
ncbi:hypothetical protein DEI99_000820 [Curtobacterium sp. MCLR17_036]|uniref:DUF6611 family protein n=1 Tax=Curtobacterium sp. MCLR17_036 TaxID=2175620 RepID=UPI000DAA1BC7|nr:DUF6611 family protein [Curtobacterium sp. MCLR17_036]WIE65102.1 hypothetical protein DEI99_000820 [Curtobacterium sp. MCLR17_036]